MKTQDRSKPEKVDGKKIAVAEEDTASLDMCIQGNYVVVYIRRTSKDIGDLLENAKDITTIEFNKPAGLMLQTLKFDIGDICSELLHCESKDNPRKDVYKYRCPLSQKDDVYGYMNSAWKSARR